jgi:tetratricopeptide (TPR) repeat protein
MEGFLRGDFLDSVLYLLPYLGFIAVMTAAPMLKLYNLALVEKNMDLRLAVVAMSAHIIIVLALWATKWYGVLLIYLVCLAVLWMLTPVIGIVHDWLTLKQLNDRDISRYRYMLSLDPNNANALIGLANAYLDRGKREEAIAAYEKARAIDPLHTGVASSRLQALFHNRVVRNINKSGVKIVSQNENLLNMDEKVTMEYVDKEDEPVIPEL